MASMRAVSVSIQESASGTGSRNFTRYRRTLDGVGVAVNEPSGRLGSLGRGSHTWAW